jgi:hypothetical protein
MSKEYFLKQNALELMGTASHYYMTRGLENLFDPLHRSMAKVGTILVALLHHHDENPVREG